MTAYSFGETLLKIDNVCLSYDGKPVLRNVSAEVKDITRPGQTTGQIVGFLGQSGIGKTQLFRIIAGLNRPTTGKVSINGSAFPVRAGEVGVVHQSYPLFDHHTVFGNLMLAACRKETDRKAAKEKVWEFLRDFDLEDRHACYPAQLSGGQRQRCAIGQQILNSEHFLLLDEPFSGLDMIMEEKTCQLLSRLAHRDEKNTIIVITHDITAAASIADHLWIMGRDRDADGKQIPGARIVKEINLIERDLCWKPNIQTSQALVDLVREIKEDFRLNSLPIINSKGAAA